MDDFNQYDKNIQIDSFGQPLVTEGVQRGSSLVSNYSFPAHAQTAGYCRICMTMEKTERFDFGNKPQAHPDGSFPEAETSALTGFPVALFEGLN